MVCYLQFFAGGMHMLVLGLQGSPRKKGNTRYLLSRFMEEIEKTGAKTRTVHVDEQNILPCKEYVVCEKKGICPIKDDMDPLVYPLLRKADVVIMASPVFFYNVTAQMKALIDRTQTLWARKYRLNLTDPGRSIRKGYVLALGATRGKNLFEGVKLTAKYFFDAVGAEYIGGLMYRRIENPGDMKNHPELEEDIHKGVSELMDSFSGRKTVLFGCVGNSCRSQMAAAFAKMKAGDRLDVLSGGSSPEAEINPLMKDAMAEKGIDMEFLAPRRLEDAIEEASPEEIITMGCGENCPFVPGAKRKDWDIPDPVGKDMDFMRRVRDDIEAKVDEWLDEN